MSVQIIEFTPGQHKVNNWVINPFLHQLNVVDSDKVGIYDNGRIKYIIHPLIFSDWLDPAGSPYGSIALLIADLNTFFFDVSLPYPEVDTRNDMPITLGTPSIGTKFLVNNPVSATIMGLPYRTFQSGLYRRDTNAGALSDWRRLNVKIQYTDAEFQIHSVGDTGKVFKFLASGLTSGTIRELTIRDLDGTVAVTDAAGATLMGKVLLDSRTANVAHFSHPDQSAVGAQAISQDGLGTVFINSATGKPLFITQGGGTQWFFDINGNFSSVANRSLTVQGNIISTGGRFKGASGFTASTGTAALGLKEIYYCTVIAADIVFEIASADIALGSTTRALTFTIKDTSGDLVSTGFKITITTEGAETIDGQSSIDIIADYGAVKLFSDGLNLFSL